MSATRDPVAAVLESLATYLGAALGDLSPAPSVLRGWPETDTAVDLAAQPQVSVEGIGAVREEQRPPTPRGEPVDGTITLTVGVLYIPLQIDAWAGYRDALDGLVAALDDALHNDALRPHLYLTAADYYGLPFWVQRESDQADIDGDTAPSGEWRHTWTLTAVIERVRPSEAPALGTITTDPTI